MLLQLHPKNVARVVSFISLIIDINNHKNTHISIKGLSLILKVPKKFAAGNAFPSFSTCGIDAESAISIA